MIYLESVQEKPRSTGAYAGDKMMAERAEDVGNVTGALWSDAGWNVKDRVPVLIR